jgi:hypothetical protein
MCAPYAVYIFLPVLMMLELPSLEKIKIFKTLKNF